MAFLGYFLLFPGFVKHHLEYELPWDCPFCPRKQGHHSKTRGWVFPSAERRPGQCALICSPNTCFAAGLQHWQPAETSTCIPEPAPCWHPPWKPSWFSHTKIHAVDTINLIRGTGRKIQSSGATVLEDGVGSSSTATEKKELCWMTSLLSQWPCGSSVNLGALEDAEPAGN